VFDFYKGFQDEEETWDEVLDDEYREQLMAAFAESPEGTACEEENDRLGWTMTFLDLAFAYSDYPVCEMDLHGVKQILLTWLPRKVAVEADRAKEIIRELRAFWSFVEREYQHPQAARIVRGLDAQAERRLYVELSKPANFGMVKSLFMMGQSAGFKMDTEEGWEEFRKAFNEQIREQPQQNEPAWQVTEFERSPPRPHKPKGIRVILSRDQRRAREKVRRQKLGLKRR
jgi:hypothetical protein